MGTDYIVAGAVNNVTKWGLAFLFGVLVLWCLCYVNKPPKTTWRDRGDGSTEVISPIYHRQAGWLLVTNTFWTGKK